MDKYFPIEWILIPYHSVHETSLQFTAPEPIKPNKQIKKSVSSWCWFLKNN
jgi:hypothetical protein